MDLHHVETRLVAQIKSHALPQGDCPKVGGDEGMLLVNGDMKRGNRLKSGRVKSRCSTPDPCSLGKIFLRHCKAGKILEQIEGQYEVPLLYISYQAVLENVVSFLGKLVGPSSTSK